MKLTLATIDGIKLPKSKKDLIVFDEMLPGFGLRIRAGGSRNWIVQYELHGHRQRRVTIGSVKVFSPEEARKAAREILAKARLGRDPQEDKQKAEEQAKLTLKSIIDRYLAEKRPKLRPRTRREIDRYLLKHWKPLHRMPLHEIERKHVAERLGGPATAAGRARSTLSALFAWAITEGLAERNPTIGTRKPDEHVRPRERVLDNDELAQVWRACGDDDYGKIIKLIVLTGCRRQEIGSMAWSELDRERGTWTIPAERTKNKRSHTLALPTAAWVIIETVDDRDGVDCLFGRKGEGFRGWATAKTPLDQRAGIAPWVLHDLRRSVATGMAELGVLPHVIEAVLNHVGHREGVAGVYNKSAYEREVRAALALWADHVRSIVEGGERKVIAIGER
jgi:integrase